MIKKHASVLKIEISLKSMTFENIKFECLFTLCILGLEAYLIEPSFFFKNRSFYLRCWSMENVSYPDWLQLRNGSVLQGLGQNWILLFQGLGSWEKERGKRRGLGGKTRGLEGRSRINPLGDVFLAAKKRGCLFLPLRLAVPHQFQRLRLFFQQHHVTWLSMA